MDVTKRDFRMADLDLGLLVMLFMSTACVSADFSSCESGPYGNLVSATYTLSRPSIPVPGQLTASLQVQLDTTIDEDVLVDVEIKRPVLFWTVTVPCVGSGFGVGSCTYYDLCAMLTYSEEMCNGQPCACPMEPGTYTFPDIHISTHNLHGVIARVAKNTKFFVKIKFYSKTTSQLLSCLQTEIYTE